MRPGRHHLRDGIVFGSRGVAQEKAVVPVRRLQRGVHRGVVAAVDDHHLGSFILDGPATRLCHEIGHIDPGAQPKPARDPGDRPAVIAVCGGNQCQ